MENNIEVMNSENKVETSNKDAEALDAQMNKPEALTAMEAFNKKVEKLSDLFGKGFDSGTIFAREKAETAIEQEKADPNSAFNQKREAIMAGEAGVEAPVEMTIEDKVAMTKQYVAELNAMIEKYGGKSVAADAVLGVELEKAKFALNSEIDKLIAEVKPTTESSDPLRSSQAGVLMNELEAMKM